MVSQPAKESQAVEVSSAGKAPDKWVVVLNAIDLRPGEMVGVDLDNRHIAVYNVEGQFFATDNVCTHAFAILTDGWLEGDIIECPLHAGQFHVRTGRALGDPVTCDLKIFETRIHANQVEVFVPTT